MDGVTKPHHAEIKFDIDEIAELEAKLQDIEDFARDSFYELEEEED